MSKNCYQIPSFPLGGEGRGGNSTEAAPQLLHDKNDDLLVETKRQHHRVGSDGSSNTTIKFRRSLPAMMPSAASAAFTSLAKSRKRKPFGKGQGIPTVNVAVTASSLGRTAVVPRALFSDDRIGGAATKGTVSSCPSKLFSSHSRIDTSIIAVDLDDDDALPVMTSTSLGGIRPMPNQCKRCKVEPQYNDGTTITPVNFHRVPSNQKETCLSKPVVPKVCPV